MYTLDAYYQSLPSRSSLSTAYNRPLLTTELFFSISLSIFLPLPLSSSPPLTVPLPFAYARSLRSHTRTHPRTQHHARARAHSLSLTHSLSHSVSPHILGSCFLSRNFYVFHTYLFLFLSLSLSACPSVCLCLTLFLGSLFFHDQKIDKALTGRSVRLPVGIHCVLASTNTRAREITPQ